MTLFFDTETHPITDADPVPKMVCIQWAEDESVPAVELPSRELAERILAAEEIVGFNVAYDLAELAQTWPDLLDSVTQAYFEERVVCLMVRAQLHACAEGVYWKVGRFSMASVMKHVLGLESHKNEWKLRYKELEGTDPAEWPVDALEYALMDALVTRELYQAMPVAADEQRHVQAAWGLQRMSWNGMRADPLSVDDLDRSTADEFDEIEKQVTKAGLVRKNGSKDIGACCSVVEAAYKKMGVKVPKTPGGRVSLAAETLEKVKAEEGSKIALLQRRSKLEKTRGTYLPVLRRATKTRVHPGYNPVLYSGRASLYDCFHQFPRRGGIRPCFVPGPGKVYVQADYSGAEMRALGQVQLDWFGRSELADVLNAGVDPHTSVAAELLKISEEEAIRRVAAEDDEVVGTRSPLAKALNFGVPGGLGAKTFVDFCIKWGLHITYDEAVRAIEGYKRRFPTILSYFARVNDLVRSGAPARVPRTDFVRGGIGFCQHCNTMFQTPVALGSKSALSKVTAIADATSGLGLSGAQVVLYFHDELILEVDEERADAACTELEIVMTECMDRITPDVPSVVDAKIMRRWEEK